MDLNHPLLAQNDDPPPFPSSYPQLIRLDRSVLCTICKEPYTGPVSINCGHSFCSQCIRSWLDSNKVCPSCNEPASEGMCRRNRALEEITESWDGARSTLITLTTTKAKRRPPPEPNSKASSSGSKGLKRVREGREGSHSRSQSPAKRSREDGQAGSIEPEDGSSDVEEVEELSETDEGECPVCQARMPIASIPMHIERGCPPVKTKSTQNTSGNQKSDWKNLFSGASSNKGKEVEMKRITKPNYKLTGPSELRTILRDYGLPTTGDKDILIARVQEWILLFNSNLDASRPRSIASLRAKLSEAEASRKRDIDKGRIDAVHELKTEEGRNKYATDKRGEFERLRQEIKERDKKRIEKVKGVGVESAIEVD